MTCLECNYENSPGASYCERCGANLQAQPKYGSLTSSASAPIALSPQRKVSAVSFAVAILCFFLPFALATCDGKTYSITGVQLMTGTEIEKDKKVDPQFLAVAAFLCGGCGIILSLWKKREAVIDAIATATGGIIFLLLLKTDGSGVKPGIGFWLALASFFTAAFMSYLESRGNLRK